MITLMKKNQIAAWILSIMVITVISLGAMVYDLNNDLRATMWESEEVKLRLLVESNYAMVKGLAERADAGEFDVITAQSMIISALRPVRYNKTDYFFIYDVEGTGIMVPPKPDREGKNWSNEKDPNGVALIDELVKVGRSGGGFVHYHFARPGAIEPIPKLSYAMVYEPWGWMMGTGTYVDDVELRIHKQTIENIILMLIVMVVVTILSLVSFRAITKPLGAITASMGNLARGDTTSEVPYNTREDAIGDMSRAVEVFRKNALRVATLEAEQHETAARISEEKKSAAHALVDRFQRTVGNVISSVTEATTKMKNSARAVSESSQKTRTITELVAQESMEASMNVQTVASATEELSASIHEISAQVSKATTVTTSAVDESKQAHNSMGNLVLEVSKITDITSFISKIAHETRLLALNATIEAARAGEAGKGFNVVAHEVKGMSDKTAQATTDITDQLSHIQITTQATAATIDVIGKTIGTINGISAGVAAAVEEQNAATNEIARAVDQTAQITQHVSEHIAEVHDHAVAAGNMAGELYINVQELETDVQGLQKSIAEFLSQVLE